MTAAFETYNVYYIVNNGLNALTRGSGVGTPPPPALETRGGKD